MKLAHFGTFDVENYGDLLFPLIVRRRLGDLFEEVVHVSPVGGPAVWGDCVASASVKSVLDDAAGIGGIVVGGGHIIHGSPTSVERYDQGGLSSSVAYASLWLVPAYLASQAETALCWNAPGVPRGFSARAGRVLQWSVAACMYVSVRDGSSRRLLEEAGVGGPIHVVPDTGLGLA